MQVFNGRKVFNTTKLGDMIAFGPMDDRQLGLPRKKLKNFLKDIA